MHTEIADFGFVAWASVGDFVFRDEDGDGVFEAGDSPLAGVVVSLRSAGGELVATTVTASDGRYSFAAVRPGSYEVELAVPAGFVLSDAAGEDSQPNPYAFTLTDTDILTADFGLLPLGSVGDEVFEDLDRDGRRDTGEPGVAGVVAVSYTHLTLPTKA